MADSAHGSWMLVYSSAFLAAWFSAALPARAADSGQRGPENRLLVANKGDRTLSIVDLDTGRTLAAVPEDGDTGHEVAVSPDGRYAFVPIYGSSGVGQKGTDGRLLCKIDLKTHHIVGTLDFGKGVRPHCAVMGPRDGLLYVTTELENAVAVIDPGSLSIVGSVPTGHPQSHMLAITRDGKRGYTANVNSGTVSALDLQSRTLVATIPVSAVVQRISLSVDDRWAFTADQIALRIAVIDTAANTLHASIPLPAIGFGTAPTPDGRWLLVALPGASMLARADLGTLRVVGTLEMPESPQEIRVSADGAKAYVSCSAQRKIAVVDLGAWRVERLIDVGALADGMALASVP